MTDAPALKVRRARTGDEVADALRLRHDVFVDEQQVPVALELDGLDAEALHIVAIRGEEVVGTCRLLWDGDRVRLGRLAVRRAERGAGIGAALRRAAEREVRQTPARTIRLHAQTSALGLYERLGYEPRGERFMEAGIEHLTMEKRLA